MLSSDYINKIRKSVRLSITNYQLDDEELDIIIEDVYNDLINDVNLSTVSQQVVYDPDTPEYDLDKLLFFYKSNETTLLGVYAITTACGIDISKCFTEVCKNTFCVKDIVNCRCMLDNIEPNDDGDRIIVFKRVAMPDFEMLTKMQQDLIYSALVLGCIERIQYMLPSPTASSVPFQEHGYQKSLYENAKMKIKNRIPQYQ